MINTAPICLSVYKRINHVKQTISALQKNLLAEESILYIFSDHPMIGDEEEVRNVRRYLKKINGFHDVFIIEREENNRVKNNRNGIKKILDDFGKVIFLEEDIVTAPGFLSYLNFALDFYKEHKNVISVSAYCPPIEIPEDYKYSTFFLPRFNAWGFGTWKNKFDPFEFSLIDYEKNIKDKNFLEKLTAGGDDIFYLVQNDYNGYIDALDIKVMYHQALYKKYTVYPRISMVQNIGHDGSGVHCRNTNKFLIKDIWQQCDNFHFAPEIELNDRILLENKKFRSTKKSTKSGWTFQHIINSLIKKICKIKIQ